MSNEATKEVATTQPAASGLAAYVGGGAKREDKTGFSAKDLTIPRIKVAQSLSPEVKEGDVVDGALFLNITGEELAAPGEPLRFIPVATQVEYIVWRDRKDNGGGLLARARPVVENGVTRYKWDNPNQTFEVKVGGVSKQTWKIGEYVDEDGTAEWGTSIEGDEQSPPIATVHYNYLLALPDHGFTLAAFSLSRTQAKRAKDLNAMIEMGILPMYARYFKASTEKDKRDLGDFFNVRFKPAGAMKPGVAEDETAFAYAKEQHDYYVAQGFTVQVDQDAAPDEAKGKNGKF